MSDYHGDIKLGDTLQIKFTTTDTTGAPTQLAGTPVISAYPTNNPTQLTAGITLTVDFDGVTGLNHVSVIASTGNGYLTATDYTLVITQGTVGGASVVGYPIASFSIQNRVRTIIDGVLDEAFAGHLNPLTIGLLISDTASLTYGLATIIGNAGEGLTALPPVPLTAAAIDAILDDPIGDGTITLRQAIRVFLAVLCGKLTIAGDTVTFRNLADSQNVVVETTDIDGQRTAVTVTP